MKLLLIIIIGYLAYRAAKSWIKRNLGAMMGQDHGRQHSIDDVMVKDPVCGIYFPRREGVELQHKGQVYLFCSTACRDRFLDEQK
ncbi:hypothetical protein Dvar_46570 [Desulfosarcina variabilis str. Montpellier]|uniref:YHS domain-containing protein n=1 Tax=Desulfosarcina variabilis TaxID=2300 RepID=UPI003AFAA7D5